MYFIIFIAGIIVGGGVVWFVLQRRMKEMRREIERIEHEKEEEEKIAFGIEEFNRPCAMLLSNKIRTDYVCSN